MTAGPPELHLTNMPNILTPCFGKDEPSSPNRPCKRSKRVAAGKPDVVRGSKCHEVFLTGADLAAWGSRHAGEVRWRVSSRR